jgi:hypothetical protein
MTNEHHPKLKQTEYQGPIVIKKLTDRIYGTVVEVAEESGYKIDDQHYVSQVKKAFDQIAIIFITDFLAKKNENLKKDVKKKSTDFIAQLVVDDTIDACKNDPKEIEKILNLLKGDQGDDMVQYVMHKYLGSGGGSYDKRILDRGKAIKTSADELKKSMIAQFQECLESIKYFD